MARQRIIRREAFETVGKRVKTNGRLPHRRVPEEARTPRELKGLRCMLSRDVLVLYGTMQILSPCSRVRVYGRMVRELASRPPLPVISPFTPLSPNFFKF
jgi:hypothetical protein